MQGLRETLLRAVDNGFLRQFIVFSGELADVVDSVPLDPRVRWATMADKEALVALGFREAKTELFLKAGRIALLEENGNLVARNCYWLNDFLSGNDLQLKLSADTVAVSDSFVDPRYRGRRYIVALKAFAAREYLAAGYRRMVSVVRLRNTASIRAHRYAGARPIFRVVILRGPLQFRAIWAKRRSFDQAPLKGESQGYRRSVNRRKRVEWPTKCGSIRQRSCSTNWRET